MENVYGAWGTGVDAFMRRDYKAAERHFKATSPSSKICFNLGMTLLMQSRFQEAIDAFNQALEYDDWMAISYFQKGACYFMMGVYDEAIRSWNDAKENIRHGEVVDYDSLHLSYMLCKSEIAVNIAIAFYYSDMTDECNAMLDEARRYSIVKDDVAAVTQSMIGGEDIYPCTVDDTTLFNPPKLPQSVLDAMKKGTSSVGGWGSAPSAPPVSSPPPATSYSSPAPPKLAPPARTAPTPPTFAKTGAPPPVPPSPNSGANSGSGPPPPPPPKRNYGAPPKKGFPKAGAKAGVKKGPPILSASPPPPTSSYNAAPMSASPTAPPVHFGAPTPPAASSGGPAPPPPPIPSGGIPKRSIPTSPDYSASTPSSAPPGPPKGSGGMGFSMDALKSAMSKRAGGGGGSASTTNSSNTSSGPPSGVRPTPSGPNQGTASPFGLRNTSSTSAPSSNPTPPASGGFLKRSNPAPASSAPVSATRTQPPLPPVSASPTYSNGGPSSPRDGSSSSGGFSFKVLAEQGARKKKIEVTVNSPGELRNHIVQAFGIDTSSLVEHYDPDFGEFVELDNGVNLSTLPNMLKVRVP